jgi:Flp pilus assembly protein TadG
MPAVEERRNGRSFGLSKSGVAAVEFALILPVLIALYLGVSEVGQALLASRKVTLVARSLADLLAQQPNNTSLTPGQLDDIFNGGKVIMSPFPDVDLRMTLTSVEIVPKKNTAPGFDAKPRWTAVRNGSTPRPCAILTASSDTAKASPASFPAGLHQGTSVIVADVSYDYRAPYFPGKFIATSRTAYEQPRVQTAIAAPIGATGVTTCPVY